jgi:hypothetical protein
MKFMIPAAVLTAGLVLAAPAIAAPTPSDPAASPTTAASSATYSTTASTLGDLLDNPATKAVLQKHVPELVANPQIEMGRGMTLKTLQSYAGDTLTDEKLAAIDADLAQID